MIDNRIKWCARVMPTNMTDVEFEKLLKVIALTMTSNHCQDLWTKDFTCNELWNQVWY